MSNDGLVQGCCGQLNEGFNSPVIRSHKRIGGNGHLGFGRADEVQVVGSSSGKVGALGNNTKSGKSFGQGAGSDASIENHRSEVIALAVVAGNSLAARLRC